MKLATYNVKGGVGKTSIAANFALTQNFGIVTNDIYSPLQRIFEKKRICLKRYGLHKHKGCILEGNVRHTSVKNRTLTQNSIIIDRNMSMGQFNKLNH